MEALLFSFCGCFLGCLFWHEIEECKKRIAIKKIKEKFNNDIGVEKRNDEI